ncbi:transporter [Saxibacter everestensis]|uniref:Transporter n=1 Tax=Saxibacter everestensis TaxID=2909229 RepID=A0ABY8QR02_9MICO|nr:transporter [Brevibacteriaceae bacterium ZFBP1038]
MVAHLVRLKVTLLGNSFRSSPWRIVGLVVGMLYGLAILGFGVAALIGFRVLAEPDLASVAVVLLGSLAVLGWGLVPLFLFGVDETLDPLRFQTFAISRREMTLGLLAAGLISVPAVITGLLALTTAVTWAYSVPAVIISLVAALVAVLTCVTLSRVTTTAASTLLASRKTRDVTAVVGLAAVVLIGPAVNLITGGGLSLSLDPERLAGLVTIVGWTPLGWTWSAGADAADGEILAGLVKLVLASGLLAGLLWVWQRLLVRSLERGAQSASGGGKVAGGLGWFSRFPATPWGAIAARSATYWRRDPRYFGSLIVIVMMPILVLVMSQTSDNLDVGIAFLWLAPIVAYLTGWGAHADVSYDNTAFALHVSSGVSGMADRVGRLVPWAIIGVASVLIFALLGGVISGQWELVPGMLGLGLGLLFAGFGMSSIVSIAFFYPTPAPGDSPFKTPPGATGITLLVQTVTGFVLLVAMSPAIVLGILAVVWRPWLGWLCLLVSLVLGAVYLLIGLRRGARIFERKAPEILVRLHDYT